jgi:hypothetical protein
MQQKHDICEENAQSKIKASVHEIERIVQRLTDIVSATGHERNCETYLLGEGAKNNVVVNIEQQCEKAMAEIMQAFSIRFLAIICLKHRISLVKIYPSMNGCITIDMKVCQADKIYRYKQEISAQNDMYMPTIMHKMAANSGKFEAYPLYIRDAKISDRNGVQYSADEIDKLFT